MKVNLKCFSTLAKTDSCDFHHSTAYDLAYGQTVENLFQLAGIAKEDVKITFVNSRIANHDTILFHGDNVGLSPAAGGM